MPATLFWIALVATLLLKLAFAAWLPFSGDEAYFAIWGNYFDWGYYDHPPMVGWLSYLLKHFGDHPLILRLPAILITPLLAIGMFLTLRHHDQKKAVLVALLFLLSPIYLLEIFNTTDAPLILFSFFSVLAWLKADQTGKPFDYLVAGGLFGLAFLSKYFAGFLGLAFLLYFIFGPRAKYKWGYALFVAAALPFIAINVYWNVTHCWANLLFNVYNRHEDAGWSLLKPLVYLAMLAYLVTPPILYLLWKERKGFAHAAPPHFKIVLYVFVIPLAIFFLFSFAKIIGLHWVLSFLPFLYLYLLQVSTTHLQRAVTFMALFALLHVLVVGAVLALPIETWKNLRKYPSIVLTAQTPEVLRALQPYRGTYVLAAEAYSPAAILTYHTRHNVPVFGVGSSHARHDDIMSDFRSLAGQNVLIFKKKPPERAEYEPYFAALQFETLDINGAKFYLVLGSRFDYEAYHAQVLAKVKEKYYQIPAYLPTRACYFCARYFPAENCLKS